MLKAKSLAALRALSPGVGSNASQVWKFQSTAACTKA